MMVLRDLPLLHHKPDVASRHKPDVPQYVQDSTPRPSPVTSDGRSSAGPFGAAHMRPRDAYLNVPILKQPTWKHEIAAYFYLGGISAGAFVLGALAELVGGKRRRTLAHTAHYVAFAAMLPCPLLLIDDLGRKSRFHHMLRIVKPSSPMNLGAWALTVHGAMSTVTVARVLAGEGKLPVVGPLIRLLPGRALAAGGLPSALTLGGYTGVLLGTTSVPLWFTSPLLGALFMASSLSTGTAATSLVSTLSGRDNRADQRTLTSLNLTFGLAETALLGGYLATTGRAARPLLRGRMGLLTAGAAASFATSAALEAASLAGTGNKRLLGALSCGATLLGGALLRWAVVMAGRASAADREGTLDAMKPSPAAPGWGAKDASR